MNTRPLSRTLILMAALGAVSCGGGSSSSNAVTTTPTLVSVSLTPLKVSLFPDATQQLSVMGTYSDGSTRSLPASGESFTSSNTGVATVSAAGVVTVTTGATAGETASITATDRTSGLTSSAADSTVVTVGSGPDANSATAAKATAHDNSLCTSITPFYWEIGDGQSTLVSGSEGTSAAGTPVTATTVMSIASASKWLYGTYAVQKRGSAGALTAAEIPLLNFTSGYTNMGSDTTGIQCPTSDNPDTVNSCLALLNSSNNLPYGYQDPTTVGRFDYDSGHLQQHASLYGGLGDVVNDSLGSTVSAELGVGMNMTYIEPLIAGGVSTTAGDYVLMLRGIVSGTLHMHDALGTSAVCTLPSSPGCNAAFSPIPEAWHYSIAHWVEDDPSTNGDGAFSSAGAYGFYPWIESSKKYYGVLAREDKVGILTGKQSGYDSARCGRLIRRAWDTGTEQTGTVPSP